MNMYRIKSAVSAIEECHAALDWLENYGTRVTGEESASVTVNLHYASACNGAKEDQKVLSRFATLEMARIIEAATQNCRNTIEISRQIIKDEAAE